MKVIAADHNRPYILPGISEPARRPVDIDASTTGFTCLQSFRMYRFQPGVTVDGHAEKDEVFVVVTAGSVEIKITSENASPDAAAVYTLSAPDDANNAPFVAYLPPHAVYQLTPHTVADIVYARATPRTASVTAVFAPRKEDAHEAIVTLLEERTYAQHLRLKVIQVRADDTAVSLNLIVPQDSDCEALTHVQASAACTVSSSAEDEPPSLPVQPWDTVALSVGRQAALHFAPRTTALIVTVLATCVHARAEAEMHG